MLDSRMKLFLAPVSIFMLVALVSLALYFAPSAWATWQPATCMPDHCFCEAQRAGFIRQPINAYSNLAFVLVGLLILANARDDWRRGLRANAMQTQRAFPMILGVSTIVIGVGSFFYHASLTFVGQWFDVMGMYLFASFALVYNYLRLRPIRPVMFALAYVVMNAMLGYLIIVNPEMRRQVFTAMIYAILALEALILLIERPRMRTRYLIGAIVSLGIADAIWMLDESGVWCSPTSWLQGHAVWHLGSALAAGLLYLYYRSERGK